jgi:predicted RNase H-like HicB family nuclease
MFTKNTKYNFSVIVERDEDGFVASCPELQGCYSQGDTYEEVMENIKDAISLNLEELRAEAQEIPAQHSISLSMVQVMA